MPSGRPRKRLSRMDAAVDAMVRFGFPANKVEKHVTQLLEVYGGHEGWPLLEEYSYKVLIDALLRDVPEDDEEEGKVGLSRMDAAVDAMVRFGFPANKVEKHVTQLLEVYGGHEGWPLIEEYSYKVLIDALLRDVPEGNEEEGKVEKLLEDESGARNIIRDEGPENNMENIVEPKSPEIANSSSGSNYVRQNVEDPKLHLPNGCLPRRRVHCYGWIDSDDEDDADDFLVLEPMPGAFGPKPDVPREDSKVLSDGNKNCEKKQRL